jgi:hypothetical protein
LRIVYLSFCRTGDFFFETISYDDTMIGLDEEYVLVPDTRLRMEQQNCPYDETDKEWPKHTSTETQPYRYTTNADRYQHSDIQHRQQGTANSSCEEF